MSHIPEIFECLQLWKTDISATPSFGNRKFGCKILSLETFVVKHFRHLLIFYVGASLKNGPMKVFIGKEFRQLTQILSLFPMQLLPIRYILFDIKHPSLCSLIFKYFTTFFKLTRIILPSFSVYLGS